MTEYNRKKELERKKDELLKDGSPPWKRPGYFIRGTEMTHDIHGPGKILLSDLEDGKRMIPFKPERGGKPIMIGKSALQRIR